MSKQSKPLNCLEFHGSLSSHWKGLKQASKNILSIVGEELKSKIWLISRLKDWTWLHLFFQKHRKDLRRWFTTVLQSVIIMGPLVSVTTQHLAKILWQMSGWTLMILNVHQLLVGRVLLDQLPTVYSTDLKIMYQASVKSTFNQLSSDLTMNFYKEWSSKCEISLLN